MRILYGDRGILEAIDFLDMKRRRACIRLCATFAARVHPLPRKNLMDTTVPVSSARRRFLPIRIGPGGSPHRMARGAKAVALVAVILLALYYTQEYALPYFQPLSDERSNARTIQVLPYLLVHIFAGMLALVLGPFQFSGRLRRRYTAVHRWIGRTYLLAVLIGSVASMYITVLHPHPVGPVFRSGIAGLAIVWFTTSLMAYVSIRLGNVQEHREWMIRSYTVTFGFVFFRIGFEQLRAMGLEFPDIAGINAWMSWAAPLFAAEVALSIARQRERAYRSGRRAAKLSLEPSPAAQPVATE